MDPARLKRITKCLALIEETIDVLAEFILKAKQLKHIDITNICLKDFIVKLEEAIIQSPSLEGLHIGDNNSSDKVLQGFVDKLTDSHAPLTVPTPVPDKPRSDHANYERKQKIDRLIQ